MSFSVCTDGNNWLNDSDIKYKGLNLAIDTIIQNNYIENTKMIKNYIVPCHAHDGEAVIVSGGPSTDFDKLRRMQKENPKIKIFCVKHSYQALVDHDIIPFACIILDARPIFGISSWGVKRSDLLFEAKGPTIFMVGTRSHPSYVYFLQKKEVPLVGYYVHSVSELFKMFRERGLHLPDRIREEFLLSNPVEGSCAAITAINIAVYLGFQKIHLFGYDGHINYVPEKHLQNDYFYNVECNGNKYWIVRESIGLAQEFTRFIQEYSLKLKIKFEMHGENTFMSDVFKTIYLDQKNFYEEKAKSIELHNFMNHMELTLSRPFSNKESKLMRCDDYRTYNQSQENHFIETVDLIFVNNSIVNHLCTYLKTELKYTPKFGICHGTRNGFEIKWFRKYLENCKVIGTEISEHAERFDDTLQWDFHDALDEWYNKVDFIYSNSFNHSYDPMQCLDIWMRCVADRGMLFLEWSPLHEDTNECRLFGSTLKGYQNMIQQKGYKIREVLNPGSFSITNCKFEDVTEPIERKIIVVQHMDLLNPLTKMKREVEMGNC